VALERTVLLGFGFAAVLGATIVSTAASAQWREPDNAFSRLACWYGGGSPGTGFGYGPPSCEPKKAVIIRHHRGRKRVHRAKG